MTASSNGATMAKRPTITDLARISGVSVATVDRVLNNRLPVKEETARRVYEAATEIGYHAAGLIKQRMRRELPEYRLGFLLLRREDVFYTEFARELDQAVSQSQRFRGVATIDFASSLAPDEIVERMRAVRPGPTWDAASAYSPIISERQIGRMASIVDPSSGLPVLETGPGTGVITKAILARGIAPQNLYSIEYSPNFVRHLHRLYPDVNVIEGDAFNLTETLGDKRDMLFDCVVSAVPLLNFPIKRRVAYLEDLLGRIPAGRPVMQITYGPLSPIPAGKGDYTVKHFDFIIRNIPPAHLWIYRRPAH